MSTSPQLIDFTRQDTQSRWIPYGLNNGAKWDSRLITFDKDGMYLTTDGVAGSGGIVRWSDTPTRHGRWDVRLKADTSYTRSGGVALLFPSSNQWPGDGEIDFYESHGLRDGYIAAVHSAQGGEHRTDSTRVPTDITEWHTYTTIWSERAVEFVLDGVLVPDATITSPTAVPSRDMFLAVQYGYDTVGGVGQFPGLHPPLGIHVCMAAYVPLSEKA